MTPPGALTSVPVVRLRVEVSTAPTAPAFVVRSMVPPLVKPLATVSVPEVLPTVWIESVAPAGCANAPATLLAPVTIIVPLLVRALATDVAPSVSAPSFVMVPVPFTADEASVNAPCAPIVVGPLSVIVRALAERVCWPVAAPFTRRPASVTFTFIVTVYVPARSITAVSAVVGSAPVDQLVSTFQLPPAALIQRTAAAWAGTDERHARAAANNKRRERTDRTGDSTLGDVGAVEQHVGRRIGDARHDDGMRKDSQFGGAFAAYSHGVAVSARAGCDGARRATEPPSRRRSRECAGYERTVRGFRAARARSRQALAARCAV